VSIKPHRESQETYEDTVQQRCGEAVWASPGSGVEIGARGVHIDWCKRLEGLLGELAAEPWRVREGEGGRDEDKRGP
jgi:hypothetical protein